MQAGGGERLAYGTREPQPYLPREAQPFPNQQQQPQPQPQPQPQQQPQHDSGDVDRLPSFITGGQPQNAGGQQANAARARTATTASPIASRCIAAGAAIADRAGGRARRRRAAGLIRSRF